MITNKERLSAVVRLNHIIESKQELLKQLESEESLLKKFTANRSNESIAFASLTNFLIPQQEGIQKLKKLIPHLEELKLKWMNPEVERMSEEELTKYFTPGKENS